MSVTNYSWPTDQIAPRLREVAQAADEVGLDTLWVADHPVQSDPSCTWTDPILSAFSALSFVAAYTRRLRLGTLVAGATFRTPAMFVKDVTTLDVLSGGRAWLGIGSGYNEDEGRALGMPLPPLAERYDLLADTLELSERLWTGDESRFDGRQLTAERPIGSPRPLTTPHPPILIGGTGPKRTMRLVARYADACNLFDIPDGGATLAAALDALRGHCADVGRSFDDVEKTITTALQPEESPAHLIDRCRALGEQGMSHVVLITRGRPWTARDVEVLGDAAAGLAA